jgi:hypothetical protein
MTNKRVHLLAVLGAMALMLAVVACARDTAKDAGLPASAPPTTAEPTTTTTTMPETTTTEATDAPVPPPPAPPVETPAPRAGTGAATTAGPARAQTSPSVDFSKGERPTIGPPPNIPRSEAHTETYTLPADCALNPYSGLCHLGPPVSVTILPNPASPSATTTTLG